MRVRPVEIKAELPELLLARMQILTMGVPPIFFRTSLAYISSVSYSRIRTKKQLFV
jgi:hypothetical protein